MEQLRLIGQRIKVVLKALPTYMVVASTVITLAAPEITEVLPKDWQGGFAESVVTITGLLAAAITIIRRVEPVVNKRVGLIDPTE